TSLRTFDSAAQLLPTLPRFAERCGSGEAQRTLLQFIYGYFSRLTNVSLDEAAFEELWNELIAEVETPFGVYRGVANLRHFHTEPAVSLIDLDDGISIRGRSRNDLLSLGVDDSMWEAIAADWR